MKPEVWQSIVDASDALAQDIDRTLPAGVPVDAARCAGLHDRLAKRLSDLIKDLATLGVPRQDVSQVIEPMAILTDERVLLHLDPQAAMLWSRLEYDLHHSNDGGGRFYSNVDELLQPGGSELAREAYAFCLAEGFGGALSDDRPRLQRYRDALAQAILDAQPKAPPAPAPPPPPGALPPSIWQAPDRVYTLVAAAIGLALATVVFLGTRALL